MTDSQKKHPINTANVLAAAGIAAITAVGVSWAIHDAPPTHRDAIEAQAASARYRDAISASQRERIEALVQRVVGGGARIAEVGQGPYGMSWAIVAKAGKRQVVWTSPGELSLMLGDLYVDGTNLSDAVRVAYADTKAIEPAPAQPIEPTAAPAPVPQAPVQQDQDVEFQQISSRITPEGVDLGVAGAFIKVHQSFTSIPLYGDGSGGEFYVFGDPDCGYCHRLLGMLNARADELTRIGFRVLWYPVGILRPKNNESLQRAAAQIQLGPKHLLQGGVLDTMPAVQQEALQQAALNTKALSEILPRSLRTPTIIYKPDGKPFFVYAGAPDTENELSRLINAARGL